MPRILSISRLVAAGAVMLVLAACTPGGQFDPTTLLQNDMFDSKKKINGPREPVFPNGVPGTASGVPPDLVKGYQPPPEQTDATADAAGVQPPPEKPKPKPRPKVAAQKPAQPPKRISIGPAPKPGTPAADSSPQQTSAPAGQSQSVWPAPPSAAPSQQSQSVFPNPPATGSH